MAHETFTWVSGTISVDLNLTMTISHIHDKDSLWRAYGLELRYYGSNTQEYKLEP